MFMLVAVFEKNLFHQIFIKKYSLRFYFSGGAKDALARPIYIKKDKQNMENYRPVSILNGFSKVYERLINDSMLPIVQKCHRLISLEKNGSKSWSISVYYS